MASDDEQWKRQQKAFDEANYHRQQGERGYRTGHQSSDEGYKSYQRRMEQQRSTNNSGCFAGDTPILTSSGWRRIEDFTKGDEVLSLNDGALLARSVFRLKRVGVRRIWNLHVENEDRTIKTTWSHSFFTGTDWKMARQLKRGDDLVLIDKRGVVCSSKILSSQLTDHVEPVYNLITDKEHNFIANGVVAHNFSFMRQVRSLASDLWNASTDDEVPQDSTPLAVSL